MEKSDDRLNKLDYEFRKKLGKRIAEIRKSREKKYTQAYLAEKVGISLTTMGNIEIGANYPESINLVKIADVLGVDVDDLFNFVSIDINYDEIVEEIYKKLKTSRCDTKLLTTIYYLLKKSE